MEDPGEYREGIERGSRGENEPARALWWLFEPGTGKQEKAKESLINLEKRTPRKKNQESGETLIIENVGVTTQNRFRVLSWGQRRQ